MIIFITVFFTIIITFFIEKYFGFIEPVYGFEDILNDYVFLNAYKSERKFLIDSMFSGSKVHYNAWQSLISLQDFVQVFRFHAMKYILVAIGIDSVTVEKFLIETFIENTIYLNSLRESSDVEDVCTYISLLSQSFCDVITLYKQISIVEFSISEVPSKTYKLPSEFLETSKYLIELQDRAFKSIDLDLVDRKFKKGSEGWATARDQLGEMTRYSDSLRAEWRRNYLNPHEDSHLDYISYFEHFRGQSLLEDGSCVKDSCPPVYDSEVLYRRSCLSKRIELFLREAEAQGVSRDKVQRWLGFYNRCK